MTVRSPSFLKAVAVSSRRRFVRFMRRSFVKMAVAAACAGLVVPLFSARAGDPPVPAANTPGATIISTSHRFLVSGMSSAENAALATAAEDVADRIESVMGRRMPFQRGQTLQLSVRYQEDNPRSQVIKAQGWVDRQLAQKLVIINPATADQEDILEGLCWLMLNSYVVGRQTFEERTTRLGTVPDWLSVGFAQSMYLSLRARNSHVVLRRWQRDESVALTDIMVLEYLPEGRWAEKAFCGVAVDCLAEQPRAGEVFGAMMERRARGGKISADWLAEVVTGQPKARDLEKIWDLWIAQQSNVKRQLGGITEEDIAALRAQMTVRPEEFGIVAATNAPSEMDFAELVEYRGEPWMVSLAAVLSLKVKGLGLGASPEFRRVTNLYGEFLDGLAQHAAAGWFSRLVRNVPSRRGLERLLASADEGLEVYRQELKAREEYVTDVERESRGGWMASDTNEIARMDRTIPRSDLQRYVDEIEKQIP